MQMHTTSFWLTLPEAVVAELGAPRAAIVDGLRGVSIALETVASVALMCDPRDIGRTLGDGEDDGAAPGRDPLGKRTGGFDPTLFLFDSIPGGVGLAERIHERAAELLSHARHLIETCPCQGGCPACVGPGDVDSSRKALALATLAALGLGRVAATAGVASSAHAARRAHTTAAT
jgi:DEAD/DEAH box helicase domain-containing protein